MRVSLKLVKALFVSFSPYLRCSFGNLIFASLFEYSGFSDCKPWWEAVKEPVISVEETVPITALLL